MKELFNKVEYSFREKFETEPTLIRSPGRVNLIGEHTDYNGGFVLPAAIDKIIVFALAANETGKGRLYAHDLDEEFAFDIEDRPYDKSDKGWPNYILGAVDQLKQNGHEVKGFDCVFGGDIPIGAGLSSSAAVEGGLLYGLSQINDLNIAKIDLVKMGQKTENEFVGVQCGIMDQFINIFGRDNRVLQIDCRSLDYQYYPFDRNDVKIVLCDTQVRRELAGSEYNKRREQCNRGVEVISRHEDGIQSLRDVSLEMLEKYKSDMEEVVYQRSRYVIEENQRVLKACQNLLQGNFGEFGKLMYQSHEGLRDDYEVSCEELDVLVDEASKFDSVLGARMMGGGFGGCTINLVEDHAIDEFKKQIKQNYKERTGKEISVYLTQIDAGTEVWKDKKEPAG